MVARAEEEDRSLLKCIGDEVKRRWYGAASELNQGSLGVTFRGWGF